MKHSKIRNKIISLASAAAMICSGLTFGAFTATAAAEVIAPQEISPGGGEIVKFVDFELEKEFSGNYSVQTDSGDELYGNVLEAFPSETEQYSGLNVKSISNKLDTEAYVLSFDFMVPQTDHIFRMILRDTAGKDISSVFFEQNGKVVISQNGQSPYRLAKGATYNGGLGFKEVGYYNAGGWHNLSVEVHPNGGGRNVLMKWYYDGKFVLDADTSNTNINALKNSTGIISNIFIGATYSGIGIVGGEKLDYDGTEKIYLDNICFSNYSKKIFYAKSSGKGNRINVNFTEGLAPGANLSNITVRNTETGEVIGVSDIQGGVSGMTFNTSDPLKPLVEYCVEFDDSIKSCMNKGLLTSICVTAPASDSAEPDVLVYNGINDKYENKIVNFSVKTPSTGYEGSNFIVSMDIMVDNPKLNAFYLYLQNDKGELLLSGKTCDDRGDFAIHKTRAPWLDTTDVKGDKSNYFHAEDAFLTGIKRKVTYTIDAEKRVIGFYIDDKLIGERVLNSSESTISMNPKGVFVGVKTAVSENINVNVENVTVYTIKRTKKPNKFRTFNRNGAECEPYTDKTLSSTKTARLYFNCDVNPDTLKAENISITDANGNAAPYIISDYNNTGKYVDIGFDGFLTKGETYTVSTTGIQDTNGMTIGNYTTKFSVNDASDFYISRIKLMSGSEITDSAVSGDVYIDADMVNSEDEQKPVEIILFAEKDGRITSASKETVAAAANADTYISNSPKIGVSSPDYIKAVFLDASTGVPYDNEISIGERTAQANKDGFYNSFEKTVDGKAGQRYFAKVYLPASGESTEPTVVAYYSGNADENGKIGFDFRISEGDPSGNYIIDGKFADGTEIADSIKISNPIEADNLTDEISDKVKNSDKSTAIADIKNIIENRTYAMSIEFNSIDEIDSNAAAEIVYNEINSKSDKTATVDEMKFIINKAVYIEAIRGGKVDNLYDYSKQLNIENTRINQFNEYSFNTDGFKKNVTAGINKNYIIKSFKDFENALYEQFVLKMVKNPDGTDNLKKVMNEFSNEIGVSKNMTSDAYVAIKNNTYNNYSELKSAVKKAEDNSGSGGGSGNGNGGGSRGGGSTGGIRDVSVSTDITDTGKAQEINKNIFDDIDDVEWAKEAIVYLAERKIVNGVGDGKFAPNDTVTRAEMAKMISGVFLTEEPSGENPFSDVSDADWSCEFIKKAYAAGLITGYDGGTFGPNDEITRQDAAVMLYRAAKKFNIEFYAEITKYFADEDEFANYAKEAISNMYNMGFINGVGDNRFAPNEKTTRAQTAKIIYTMIQM